MLNDILVKLHSAIPLGVVMLPLLPKHILKHIFFIPILLPIIWLFYGGCPITKMDSYNISKKSYIHNHFTKIYKNITRNQTEYIITIVLMFSIICSTFKLMK
jgi:hypothetical protein